MQTPRTTDRTPATRKPRFSGRASRLEEVDAVCLALRDYLKAQGWLRGGFAVELLAREALNNAILHGNRNRPCKTARLDLRLGRRWTRMQVEDEGAGFNWRAVRFSVPENSDTSGRGLSIISLYADRVSFNRSGNQITFWFDKQTT